MKSNESTTPKSKTDDNSDELDSLVSDLLKQAIKESDMMGTPQADDKDGGNATSSKKPPYENKFNHPGITLSKTAIEHEFGQKTKEASVSADTPDTTEAQKPVLTSVTTQKRKMPSVILGFIGILAIAGIIAYLIYSNSGQSGPEAVQNDALKNFSQTDAIDIETTSGAIATPGSEQDRTDNAIMNDSNVPVTDPAAASPSSSKPDVERSVSRPPAQKRTAVKKVESVKLERSSSTQSTKKKSKPAKIASNPAPDVASATVTVKSKMPKATEAKQTVTSTPSGPKTDNSKTATVSGAQPSTDPAIQEQETVGSAVSISGAQNTGSVDTPKSDTASETGKNTSSGIQDPLASTTNTKETQPSANKPGQNIVGEKDEATSITPLQGNIEDARSKPVPGAQNAPGELGLTPAKLVSRVNPAYPRIGLHARLSGIVELKVTINEEGRVTKAVPVSGPEIFYEEAIKAVRKWKFEPAAQNGINIASETNIKIRFNAK